MAPKKAAAKGPAAPEVVTPAQRPLVFLEIVEAAAWERYEQDKAAAEAAAAADAAAGIADDAGAEAAAESGAAANAPAAPPAYRLVFELLSDVVPRTAENFRQFACNTATVGDKKATRVVGYKGTKLLRWTQDFVQMGDVSGRDDGKGQESIHGHPTFDDEPFGAVPHKFGTLTMCNSGPNSNGSQFAIIAAPEPLPHLDGRHVAFGYFGAKQLRGRHRGVVGGLEPRVPVRDGHRRPPRPESVPARSAARGGQPGAAQRFDEVGVVVTVHVVPKQVSHASPWESCHRCGMYSRCCAVLVAFDKPAQSGQQRFHKRRVNRADTSTDGGQVAYLKNGVSGIAGSADLTRTATPGQAPVSFLPTRRTFFFFLFHPPQARTNQSHS